MREVYPNIYLEELPLTGNPLKSINVFIVKTQERNLIIDTGFNNDEVKQAMTDYVRKLDLDLSKTDLFLTHLHSDHVGLAGFLTKEGIANIYMSAVDGELVKAGTDANGEHWSHIIANAHKQGLSVDGLKIEDHPGFKNRPSEGFDFVPCHAGDKLDIGEFHFTMIDEEGHSPGMLGLYEPEKKILFCGDHILGKITPNITYWGEEYGDSLGIYLKNLKKLKDYKIEFLFSSHRFLVEDVNARIDELVNHHEKRLNETLSILERYGKLTVRDITRNMHWDISAKSWEEFPASQKWFAAGEAAAHLVYLIHRGKVKEEIREDGVALYSTK